MPQEIDQRIKDLETENAELRRRLQVVAQEVLSLRKQQRIFEEIAEEKMNSLTKIAKKSASLLAEHSYGLNEIPQVFEVIDRRLDAVEGYYFDNPVDKDLPN